MMEDNKGPEPLKILSFEEFTRREDIGGIPVPYYANFFQYFAPTDRQKWQHYRKFAKEHPELNTSLCKKISELEHFTPETLQPLEPELYEAYKTMRAYGVSDDFLFFGKR